MRVQLLWLLAGCVYSYHDESTSRVVNSANYIFNSIHASMRQFASSWNHNGMAYFLATIPKDTVLYHGRSTPQSVRGVDWLAFEPEHASILANGKCANATVSRHDHIRQDTSLYSNNDQAPLEPLDHGDDGRPPPDDGVPLVGPGYLHTYRTKHSLSLLYLDGMSAGKSFIGTLDTTEYILLNRTFFKPIPDFGEISRALDLCAMVKNEWDNHIDGIIRMESGFEVILCDFEKHLDLLSVVSSRDVRNQTLPGWDTTWSFHRKVAARYYGIGGGRVKLNYDDFVTAYTYYDAEALHINGYESPPRLTGLSFKERAIIRSAVDDLIFRNPLEHGIISNSPNSTDWQAMADMIVTRYNDDLPYMSTLTDLTFLQNYVLELMRSFIDFSARDTEVEMEKCAHYGLPGSLGYVDPRFNLISSINSNLERLSTAAIAMITVSRRICHTMFSIMEVADINEAQLLLRNLMTYLDWTTWRDCPGKCGHNEMCFIPTWPRGSYADRQRGMGRCVDQDGFYQLSQSGNVDPNNYWNKKWNFPGGWCFNGEPGQESESTPTRL